MRTIAMVVMGEFTRSSNRQEYLKRSLGEPLAKRATVRRSFLIALYRCYTSAISQLQGSLGRALGVPWRPCRAFCEQTPATDSPHAMWEYMRFACGRHGQPSLLTLHVLPPWSNNRAHGRT
jgi:hypothetical protein